MSKFNRPNKVKKKNLIVKNGKLNKGVDKWNFNKKKGK